MSEPIVGAKPSQLFADAPKQDTKQDPKQDSKRKGGRPPSKPDLTKQHPAKSKPLTDSILQCMRKLEPELKMPVMVSQVLRSIGSDIRKADFDSAVVNLLLQKKLTLVWNDAPEGHHINEYEEQTVHTFFALLRTEE